MNNMASVATNDKAVLEQLVANKTTQYTVIKALLQDLKSQRGFNNYRDGMRKILKTQRDSSTRHCEGVDQGRLLLKPQTRRHRQP